jgi:hypothetical protein
MIMNQENIEKFNLLIMKEEYKMITEVIISMKSFLKIKEIIRIEVIHSKCIQIIIEKITIQKLNIDNLNIHQEMIILPILKCLKDLVIMQEIANLEWIK